MSNSTVESDDEGVRRRPGSPAAIYVHVPVCASRCPYCDYPVRAEVDAETVADRYVAAVFAQLRRHTDWLQSRQVESIYIGGGTPSALPDGAVGRLVRGVRDRASFGPAEVTLDANPEDVGRESLQTWADAGVTRLNIGVQSLQPDILTVLGRRHGPVCGRRAIASAGEFGPEHVGVDLLFGVPGQTLEHWRDDLAEIGKRDGLDYVSGYEFAGAAETPVGARLAAGQLSEVPADSRGEMLETLAAAARDRGLSRYGAASFARPAAASRQMRLYWSGGEYLGVGAGARGFRIEDGRPVRTSVPADLGAYLDAERAQPETSRLDPVEYLRQRLALGLRSSRGVDLEVVDEQFGAVDDEGLLARVERMFERWTGRGWVERDGRRFAPTDAGFRVRDGLERSIRSTSPPGSE